MLALCFPATSRMLSRFAPPQAGRRTLVHAATRATTPPVAIDESQIAKIVQVQHETTHEDEMRRLRGGETIHAATERVTHRRVLATEAGLFAWNRRLARYPGRARVGMRRPRRAARGFAPLTGFSMKYFAHWLLDGLPAALLAEPGEEVFLPPRPDWGHAADYLARLGLAETPGPVLYDRLCMPEDLGMNPSRQARLAALKDRIRADLPGGLGPPVYIRRGATGAARLLANEPEMLDRALGGFTTVEAGAPLDRMLPLLARAPVIVSVEGSQMAHAVLAARPDARIITINPADRFNNLFVDYAPALGGVHGTVVAARAGQGYAVDVDHLRGFIARLAG